MYVDDSVTGGNIRRRSATEDDNPPSPVMDNIDVFNISQSHSTGSPGTRQRTDVRKKKSPTSGCVLFMLLDLVMQTSDS